MMVAGYALGRRCRPSGGTALWLGVLVGVVLTRRARPAARCAHAAAAGRLPRHRDHRGGRDHPADDRRRGVLRRPSAARTASPASSRGFRDAQPLLRAGRHRRGEWGANDFWVMTVGWALVAVCCLHGLAADAQPLGPGAQVDPRGRGRRPLARQERLLLQDAVADHRRCHRCPRRVHDRAAVGRGRSVVLRHRRDVLRLHRAADRRRRPGARAGGRRDHLLVPDHLPRHRSSARPPAAPTRSSRARSWTPTRRA